MHEARILIVPIIFGSLVACSSPDPERTATPASTPATPAPPTAVALNGSEAKLPPNFVRDEIERVYQDVRVRGKAEFETSGAYRDRLAHEAQNKLYTFVVEPFLPLSASVVYDADRARMVMRLWVKRDPSTTDIEEESITFPIRNKVEVATYPATNAFGVQVQVRRTSEVAHALAAVPVPVKFLHRQQKEYMVEGRYHECLEYYVAMSPDEARTRKDYLRFIILARLATQTKARTYMDNYEWKATITSPTARYTETHAVYADVRSIHVWIADTETGDILAKSRLAEVLKIVPRK